MDGKQIMQSDFSSTEFAEFINAGLRDVENNNLLDFDTVFDKLRERYNAND